MKFDLSKKQEYTNDSLNIVVYYEVLPEDTTHQLMDTLLTKASWRDSFFTKSANISHKRNKCIYGSTDIYKAIFRDTLITSKINNWDRELKILQTISELLSETFNDTLNTCVLQYYANESVGINPIVTKKLQKNKQLLVCL
jgi:hypothetical protein